MRGTNISRWVVGIYCSFILSAFFLVMFSINRSSGYIEKWRGKHYLLPEFIQREGRIFTIERVDEIANVEQEIIEELKNLKIS